MTTEISDNPFLLPVDQYKRDLDMMGHYVDQSARYLVQTRGIDFEQAKQFVKSTLSKDGARPFKDVKFTHAGKKPNGDREKRVSGLYQYLNEAVTQNNIIAPTLTRYLNHETIESPLVTSIDKNVAKRNVNKKMMADAKMRGDKALAIAKKGEQTGNKLSNNALSGGHVSASNPLFNKTGHNSLTSTCRTTSGYGNANNEKLLGGNRHYWRYDIVLNNIASITQNTDYVRLEQVMTKYNLHYPSSDEVFEVIKFSAGQYMRGWKSFGPIRAYVDALNPLERAAFVYTGDLYHVKHFNDAFMRKFISELSQRITTPLPLEEAEAVIKSADDDFIAMANQLQGLDMKGQLLKDLEGTDLYGQVAATIKNTRRVIEDYRDFIQAIMVTNNVPASLAYFPSSIRHVALTSDTDSTIFTVQDWIKWHRGDYILDEDGIRAMAAMVFLASQAIVHILAMMSTNIGVPKSRIHQISMKNEYRFDVYFPTNQTKHYFAIMGAQEGNVFSDYVQEIKGVHLRSSKVSAEVMSQAADLMRSICESIARGEKISILDVINQVIQGERLIIEDVRHGNSEFFRFEQIKESESYRKGDSDSPYRQYTLWRDVFAPKYGETEAPPYVGLKINSTINTPTRFNEWLESLEDKALEQRFRQWMKENNKNCINVFVLPMTNVRSSGIPPELLPLIDLRRLVVDNMSVFYKIMEALSFHMLNEDITLLLGDYFKLIK